MPFTPRSGHEEVPGLERVVIMFLGRNVDSWRQENKLNDDFAKPD